MDSSEVGSSDSAVATGSAATSTTASYAAAAPAATPSLYAYGHPQMGYYMAPAGGGAPFAAAQGAGGPYYPGSPMYSAPMTPEQAAANWNATYFGYSPYQQSYTSPLSAVYQPWATPQRHPNAANAYRPPYTGTFSSNENQFYQGFIASAVWLSN